MVLVLLEGNTLCFRRCVHRGQALGHGVIKEVGLVAIPWHTKGPINMEGGAREGSMV